MSMNRRQFIQTAATIAAAATVVPKTLINKIAEDLPVGEIYRFGRHGYVMETDFSVNPTVIIRILEDGSMHTTTLRNMIYQKMPKKGAQLTEYIVDDCNGWLVIGQTLPEGATVKPYDTQTGFISE